MVTVVFLCIGTFFAVILGLLLLSPELFFVLNIWQLVAVSLAITIPILYANCILTVRMIARTGNDEEKETKTWALAGFISTSLSYLSLLTCYFLDWRFKYMIMVMAVLVLLLHLLASQIRKSLDRDNVTF